MQDKTSAQTLIDVKNQIQTLENRIVFLDSYCKTLLEASQKEGLSDVERCELLDKHYKFSIERQSKIDLLQNKKQTEYLHEEMSRRNAELKYMSANMAAMVKAVRNAPMTLENSKLRGGIIDRFSKGYAKIEEQRNDFKLLGAIINESKIEFTPVTPE